MEGIRKSKTVGDVVHNCVLQNGKVVQESYGATVMQFIYDTNGKQWHDVEHVLLHAQRAVRRSGGDKQRIILSGILYLRRVGPDWSGR